MKKRLLVVFLCVVLIFTGVVLWGAVPYAGDIKVSAATKAAFSADNFYGENGCAERIMLLEDSGEAFRHRINIIKSAQKEIYFSTYITHDGAAAKIFYSALLAKADEGVKVNILVNANFFKTPKEIKYALVTHKNIDYYEYNPINFSKIHYSNVAMHDKILLADDKYLIFGDRNIGDKYYNFPDCDEKYFLGSDLFIYNPDENFAGAIVDTKAYFHALIDCSFTKKRELISKNKMKSGEKRKGEMTAVYNDYIAGTDFSDIDYGTSTIAVNKITLISNPIEGAKKEPIVAYNLYRLAKESDRVVIQSPYLTLTKKDLGRLRDIADNTEEFIILTNSLATNDHIPSFYNYYALRQRVVDTGIEIYEFQEADYSLHSKTFLFDGRLTAIGSFNLSERSVRIDTETMMIIDSTEFNEQIEAYYARYKARSLRVNGQNEYDSDENVAPAEFSNVTRFFEKMFGYILNAIIFLL